MTDAGPDDLITMNLRIQGEVQGVGYRYFALKEAQARRLSGWVRNRSDGSVEALAHGARRDVEAFITSCMRGPAGARVTAIDLSPAEDPAEPSFTQRPTV